MSIIEQKTDIENNTEISQNRHIHNYDIDDNQIYIFHDLHPEDNAMLQSLYSRSPKGVLQHIDKVRSADSGSFMEKFYVGYGHNSIADCGSTTIFIENVSMLVAKAIQDWPLYNGQEASTRYIDYANQKILNPVGTEDGDIIQHKWLEFYNQAKEELIIFLTQKYPQKEGEKDSIYQKAIQARGFDILRGFLPAGCTTYLSWHTNLRQAHEHLALLEHHPLNEVKNLAIKLREELTKQYANSFSHKKYSTQEHYFEQWVSQYSYFNPTEHPDFEFSHNLKQDYLQNFKDLLSTRPIKTNLPNFLGKFGQCNFKFKLDFGSFRDIQRHRNGECLMPLLTFDFGFYQWYLDQLPESLRQKALDLLAEQEDAIKKLTSDQLIQQYYIPMGYTVAVDVTYKLPAAIYLSELRSGKTVHPTLRKRAQQMGQALADNIENLMMHLDLDLDDWDIRRGTQDITLK